MKQGRSTENSPASIPLEAGRRGIEPRVNAGEMAEMADGQQEAGSPQPDGIEAGAEGALAFFFAVGTAQRWRLEAEWLAQKLAGFGHSPTRKDGRMLDCGHYFCRDGCAFCWLEAAEKATGRTMEQKPRRRAGRKQHGEDRRRMEGAG